MKQADIKRARTSLQTERTRITEEKTRLVSDRRAFDAMVKAYGDERGEILPTLHLLTARFGLDVWADTDNLADVLRHCLLEPLVRRDRDQVTQLTEAQEQIRRLLVQVERAPARPTALPKSQPQDVAPAQPVTPSVAGHAVKVMPLDGPRPAYRPECECTWTGTVSPTRFEAETGASHHARTSQQRTARGA